MLHSIDYEEHIYDGFYDCWGEFPEVAPAGSSGAGFPSLKVLKKLRLAEGDLREVILLVKYLLYFSSFLLLHDLFPMLVLKLQLSKLLVMYFFQNKIDILVKILGHTVTQPFIYVATDVQSDSPK